MVEGEKPADGEDFGGWGIFLGEKDRVVKIGEGKKKRLAEGLEVLADGSGLADKELSGLA